MALQDFIKEDLIKIHLNCADQDELFDALYQEALNLGYVTEPFLQKVKDREATFPTGLSMGTYSVAIPHTDPEYVLEQFIAVATLEKPVTFQLMEDKTKQTDVSVVLMLGLNEPHSQLAALQEIMQLIQDESQIKRILAANSSSEVREIFKKVETNN